MNLIFGKNNSIELLAKVLGLKEDEIDNKFPVQEVSTGLPFTIVPKKVILSYDRESGKLNVSVPHPVKNVDSHYIESLAVTVDGESIITLDYTAQSSLESNDVEIEIPDLKSGSVIEVKAVCNKMGSKKGSLTIE